MINNLPMGTAKAIREANIGGQENKGIYEVRLFEFHSEDPTTPTDEIDVVVAATTREEAVVEAETLANINRGKNGYTYSSSPEYAVAWTPQEKAEAEMFVARQEIAVLEHVERITHGIVPGYMQTDAGKWSVTENTWERNLILESPEGDTMEVTMRITFAEGSLEIDNIETVFSETLEVA